ncbi:MAG TPA: cupredoxin family copper-binding protein [Anaerolineae bacterium]|nr:cupredoxin family copper-binding protein [Anaerolineae bacterium]
MQKHSRILIALTIFFSGMALIPFVAFPSERIAWHQFADAYQPSEVEVNIEGFAFMPDPLVVPAGTTVRWTNKDDVSHTVTSDLPGLLDSGTLLPGERFEYRFDTAGSYSYICTIHPSMTGTVIVLDRAFSVYLPLVTR